MKGFLTLLLMGSLMAGAALVAQSTRSPADLFQEGLQFEEVKGDLPKAIATYQSIVDKFAGDRAIAAKALLHIAMCYERMGKADTAKAYEKVVREYGDQKEIAAQGRARLAALDGSKSSKPDSGVTVSQIWIGAGNVWSSGSISSDGRFLVTSTPTSTRNVAIHSFMTGEDRLVTHAADHGEGSAAGFSVISPDGRQVAYRWNNADGGYSLRIAGADNARSRVLLNRPGIIPSRIAWSPNQRQIAAVLTDYAGDRTSQIALISVADGTTTRLTSTGTRTPWLGGFSPDGRFLVYSLRNSPSGNDGGIFAISLDGSRETTLVRGPNNDAQPVWTPDGRMAVFLSDRSGTQDLWAVHVNDGIAQGSPERVRANIGQIDNLGFSRDGSYFYEIANPQSDVYVAGINPDTLEITAQPARLSERSVGSNVGPAWSPDGRSIAFVRGTDRRSKTLVVRSLPDGAERTLPTKIMDGFWVTGFGPRWFPDSQSLMVPDADSGQQFMFRRVDVQTGRESELFAHPWGASIYPLAALSPDGKLLYYTASEAGPNPDLHILLLLRRDLETRQETELYRATSPGVGLFGLCLSPEGGQLAFMTQVGANQRTLTTLPTAGGPPRELYRGDSNHPLPAAAVWTRDGKYVLAVSLEDGSNQQRLWAFPSDGGEPRKLDLTMSAIRSMQLSPDGRRLAFTGTQARPGVWTIKNLLPNIRGGK
jgi:Tol biopolymer transport system component